jgi:hypothetical protein
MERVRVPSRQSVKLRGLPERRLTKATMFSPANLQTEATLIPVDSSVVSVA